MSANYLEANQIAQRLLQHLTNQAAKLIQPEPRQDAISPDATKHTLKELLKPTKGKFLEVFRRCLLTRSCTAKRLATPLLHQEDHTRHQKRQCPHLSQGKSSMEQNWISKLPSLSIVTPGQRQQCEFEQHPCQKKPTNLKHGIDQENSWQLKHRLISTHRSDNNFITKQHNTTTFMQNIYFELHNRHQWQRSLASGNNDSTMCVGQKTCLKHEPRQHKTSKNTQPCASLHCIKKTQDNMEHARMNICTSPNKQNATKH